MTAPKATDEEFLSLIEASATWAEVAERSGIGLRQIMRRRRNFEAAFGVKLSPGRPASKFEWHPEALQHSYPEPFDAILFGDSHIWPEVFRTPAFKALLIVAGEVKPRVCVDMGDGFDGATISRFPKLAWEKRPSVKEELEANQAFYSEIAAALPKNCRKVRLLGNHDLRWMATLANKVPEFEGIVGFDIAALFPDWHFARSLVLNDTLLCLHRFGSGVHAGYSNTVKAGVSTATGHDHKLEARPFTDMRGMRYGIRTGTLADIYGPQFEYCEQQPVDWCPGFVVVHFDGSKIYPEPVAVSRDSFRFRGKTYVLGENGVLIG